MSGGCFDCGKTTGPPGPRLLKSIMVSPEPRETSRGKISPGGYSIALCPECFKKEVRRAVVR